MLSIDKRKNNLSFRKRWKNMPSKKKKRSLVLVLLIIALFFLVIPRPLHIVVSNQSYAEPYVNITVKVNGMKVISGEFYVACQHNYMRFDIVIYGSVQRIVATNEDINVSNSAIIFAPSGGYVKINYWYYPSTHYNPMDQHFSIKYQLREPIII